MDHARLANFGSALEKLTSDAGLPRSEVESIILTDEFQRSCLTSALQLYASGDNNFILMRRDEMVERLFQKAELTNERCKYDLPSEHADRVVKYELMDVPEDAGRRDICRMFLRYNPQMPSNHTALLAFLTHASVNMNIGRDVLVVLLSEFHNGRDELYTYGIRPDNVGGRKLVMITTATQDIDYLTKSGPIWSPDNMPDPCKVFVVTMS